MKRTHGITIGLALLAYALSTSTARADQMVFQSVNGAAYGGFYVSPYTGTNLTLGKVMQLYCLDFNHSVYFGQQWTAQVQKLSPANMAGYQYGAINASFVNAPGDPLFARYQSAAWLFTQEGPAPTTRALGVYEFAAWELFLDSAHQAEFDAGFNSIDDVDPITHHTFQFDVAQALAAALSPANYGKVDLSRWNVVSPANAGTPNSVQEFLTPVPEPSLAILTAISVLGLIAFGRRRRTT